MIRSFEKLDKIHAVNRQCFTKLSFDYENIQPTANEQSAICTPQLHAVYTSCRSPHCRRFSAFSSRTASPPRPAFPMFYGFQRQAASLHGPFPSADARQNRDEYPCACLSVLSRQRNLNTAHSYSLPFYSHLLDSIVSLTVFRRESGKAWL